VSLIVFGLICAAAASAGGAAFARVVARRRSERTAREEAAKATAAEESPERALRRREEEALPLRLGDVVQHDDATRWPRSGLYVRYGGELRAVVLVSREADVDQAIVAFAPPERHILWLERVDLELPPTPPSRLEARGRLLDRRVLLPCEVECRGDDAPLLAALGRDGSASFAWYEGAAGEAAVLLKSPSHEACYAGTRLAPDDYDRLGQVDPDEDQADPDRGAR
jgi:hypothetical protein